MSEHRLIVLILFLIVMSGCSALSTDVSGKLAGTHVRMEQVVGEQRAVLDYHNPKDIAGEFQARAWMRPSDDGVGFDMGIAGGGAAGSSIDLSHSVETTKAQMEVITNGINTLADLARKFPGLVGP